MSLRTKLLFLFAGLAVAPLLLVGVFDYVHATRTVEAHLAAQSALVAEPVARAIEERLATLNSDLALLAENAESQRLFQAAAGGRPEPVADSIRGYLEQAWQQFSPWYHSLDLVDREGRVLVRLGAVDPLLLGSVQNAPYRSEWPVVDGESGAPLGSVVALARIDALLPAEALAARFGEQGYSVVVDRRSGRVLHHPRYALRGQPLDSLPAAIAEAVRDSATEPVRYAQGDTARVAVLTHFASPPWSLVTGSSIDEFAAPFVRMRRVNLALVGAIAVAVAIVSMLVIRRETRSLTQLTAAAERVGRGDFSPDLPAAGADEVGRLSAAFGAMATRVREMMTQVERSRQMAAIGEFAAEISHEIRNPLTSVKLNLQRIQRVDAEEALPPAASRPLEISLREIRRLERVVRGVLYLGRPRAAERAVCEVGELVAEAMEPVRPHAERNGVALEMDAGPEPLPVSVDRDQLRSALVNLLLNAVEAMPAGGVARVDARREGEVAVLRVSDTGPGIAPDLRDALFRPFYTTKPEGTGLGLAIALRAVEENGGRLSLEDPAPGGGATFRVEIPLAAAGGAG